jgi:hypothetical protein
MNLEAIAVDTKTLASLIFEIQNLCPWPLNKHDSLNEIEIKLLNSKSISAETQLNLTKHLSVYLEIMHELKDEKNYEPLTHLKKYLNKLDWKVCELEKFISDQDVIEIYDHQGLQVYRCFNFFKYSSYSFADIVSHHWWELYERNPFIGKTLGDLGVKIFTQNISEPICLDLPIHKTAEIWSLKKGLASLRHKNLIPLKNSQGQTVAIVAPIQVLDFHFMQSASDDLAKGAPSSP